MRPDLPDTTPSRRPVRGVGTSYHTNYAAELLAVEPGAIDWIEVAPERLRNADGRPSRRFDPVAERWPVAAHCSSLSLAGGDAAPDGPAAAYLARAIERWQIAHASDHAGFSEAGGRPLFGAFAPVMSAASAARMAARARAFARRLGVPLLIENLPVYARARGSELDEAGLLTAVLEQSDCGLLLDLTTVVENSRNGHYDARAFVDRLPAARIAQIHLRGCMPFEPAFHALLPASMFTDVVVETHEGPVSDAVWALYRHTLARVGAMVPTCIEWDAFTPEFPEVLAHVELARAHARAALATAPDG